MEHLSSALLLLMGGCLGGGAIFEIVFKRGEPSVLRQETLLGILVAAALLLPGVAPEFRAN